MIAAIYARKSTLQTDADDEAKSVASRSRMRACSRQRRGEPSSRITSTRPPASLARRPSLGCGKRHGWSPSSWARRSRPSTC